VIGFALEDADADVVVVAGLAEEELEVLVGVTDEEAVIDALVEDGRMAALEEEVEAWLVVDVMVLFAGLVEVMNKVDTVLRMVEVLVAVVVCLDSISTR
jgi:hypothetical protein